MLTAMGLGAITAVAGCGEGSRSSLLEKLLGSSGGLEAGRLRARPSAVGENRRVVVGFHSFGEPHGRQGYLFVPAGYRGREPSALVVTFHGAGGDGETTVRRLIPHANRTGAVVLGIKSEGATWDYTLGGYGPDVEFLDSSLGRIFDRFAIDPARIGAQGFSDGASYALSLGITNGDLFRHVVAYSPGYMDTGSPHGSPSFFITHGTEDPKLPIDQTSREIVPQLRAMGYAVAYREFSGKHEIPRDLEPEALTWIRNA